MTFSSAISQSSTYYFRGQMVLPIPRHTDGYHICVIFQMSCFGCAFSHLVMCQRLYDDLIMTLYAFSYIHTYVTYDVTHCLL